MAQTSREIRRQIDDTRTRIGTVIAELESKVDPRRVIDDHPLATLGVAFAAGVLLSSTDATSRTARQVRERVRQRAGRVNSTTESVVQNVVDAVVGGVSSTVVMKLGDLLDRALGSGSRRQNKSKRTVRAA